MRKKIFISGATGFQGSAITKEVLSKGDKVVSLTSSEDKLIQNDEIKILKGSFEDKTSLQKALCEVDAAVFTFPLIFDIEKAKAYTINFVSAAKENNVNLIVYNASFDLPSETTGYLALDMKIEIKKILDNSGLNIITLVPDIYIDNIAAPWSIPIIHNEAIVPYPIESDSKFPWISHFDLAKYVSSALDKPELSGQVLPINSGSYTGEEISESIGKTIGKQLNFVSVTPNDFEKQLVPAFGELAGREISNLYRYVNEKQDFLRKKSFSITQEKLEVKPQKLQDWVQSIDWSLI